MKTINVGIKCVDFEIKKTDFKINPIQVVETARNLYINGVHDSMCYCFMNALSKLGCHWKWYMYENIPLFNFKVAVDKFGADGVEDGFWWDISEKNMRIKYFDWLIEQYKEL